MEDKYWRENLKFLIDSSGLNQKEFEHKSGVSQSHLSLLINGKRPFTQKTLDSILKSLNKTYHDLFAKPVIQHLDNPLSIHVASNGHKDLLNGTADDYRGIPLYESGRLAAGTNGMAFDPYDEPSSIVVVYRKELQGCSHHNLAAMRVGGDSMEPTIAEGAIVVVDLSDKEFASRNIFAVNTPDGGVDMVSVKRIQKWEHGFSIISDNPKYPPYLSPLDWNRLCVGRVVWMWKNVRDA